MLLRVREILLGFKGVLYYVEGVEWCILIDSFGDLSIC